jgi:N-acetylglucosamine-6-phosphate deacetylase
MELLNLNKIKISGGTLISKGKKEVKSLNIQDKKIVSFDKDFMGDYIINAEGMYVLPGLIDMHFHGVKGKSVTDENPSSLEEICLDLLKQGITAFLPSGSADLKKYNMNLLRNVNLLNKKDYIGAEIIGVFMEGPFINVKKRGAQPEEFIEQLNLDLLKEYIKEGQGLIKMFVIAPELPGAVDFIRYLKREHILVSAGHTNATYEEMINGIDEGISVLTHFYNGMSGLHHREPGCVGAGLLDNRVVCELICDGAHIHPKAIELAIKNKGCDMICMVSDNGPLTGVPYGVYEMPGRTISVRPDGNYDNSGSLAGSQKTLLEDFKFMVLELGYPIEEVSQMTSYNQAKLLNLDDRKGSLCIGKDGDIIILSKSLELKYVIKGNMVMRF